MPNTRCDDHRMQLEAMESRLDYLSSEQSRQAKKFDDIEQRFQGLESANENVVVVMKGNTEAVAALAVSIQELRVKISDIVTDNVQMAAERFRRANRFTHLSVAVWVSSAVAGLLAMLWVAEHRDTIAWWLLP